MGLIRYVLSLLATLFLVIVEINLAPLLIPYFLLPRQRSRSRDEQSISGFSLNARRDYDLCGRFYVPQNPRPTHCRNHWQAICRADPVGS